MDTVRNLVKYHARFEFESKGLSDASFVSDGWVARI
jgi:hypothetical protein